MSVWAALAIWGYEVMAILVVSLLIFKFSQTLRVGKQALSPFDLVGFGQRNGKSSKLIDNPLVSGILSGAVLILILLCVTGILLFAGKVLPNGTSLLLVLVFTSAMYSFLSNVRLKDLLSRNIESKVVVVLLLTIISLVIAASWLLVPSWLTGDILFVAFASFILGTVGPQRLRVIGVVFVMLIAFDIAGVWLSGYTTQLAQPVHVLGQSIYPPLLLAVPSNPLNLHSDLFAAIGMGDVVIGGICVLSLAQLGLGKAATVGYCLGVVIAFLIASLVPTANAPALLTIIPSVWAAAGVGKLIQKLHRKPVVAAV